MSAMAMRPDLFLPRKQVPTQRDRDIFLAVVAGQTQQEIAQEFGVSQPRVAQVFRRVSEWVEEWAPPELVEQALAEAQADRAPAKTATTDTAPLKTAAEATAPLEDVAQQDLETEPSAEPPQLSPPEQLRVAEWVALQRLEYVYGQSVAGWQQSQQDERQSVVRHVGDQVIREERTKSQCGRVGFLGQAMRAATALARLQGVDVTGKEARQQAALERQQPRAVEPKSAVAATSPEMPPAASTLDRAFDSVPAATPLEECVELPADRRPAAQASPGSDLSSRLLARTTYNEPICEAEARSAGTAEGAEWDNFGHGAWRSAEVATANGGFSSPRAQTASAR